MAGAKSGPHVAPCCEGASQLEHTVVPCQAISRNCSFQFNTKHVGTMHLTAPAKKHRKTAFLLELRPALRSRSAATFPKPFQLLPSNALSTTLGLMLPLNSSLRETNAGRVIATGHAAAAAPKKRRNV